MENKRKNSSLEDAIFIGGKQSSCLVREFAWKEYNLYLHGQIGECDEFMEHYSVLLSATENDTVFLHINSNGGSLDAGIELINHIKQCNCPVIAILHHDTASMASIIALNCDGIVLNPLSTMMCHSLSTGFFGKESDIYTQAEFTRKLNEKLIRDSYKNFLSEEEIKDLLKGVEIYLHSEELAIRVEKLMEIRNQGEDEFVEEEAEVETPPLPKPKRAARKPKTE